jgi:hypothetical protein
MAMRLFEIRAGTLENKEGDVEWHLNQYTRTGRKKEYLWRGAFEMHDASQIILRSKSTKIPNQRSITFPSMTVNGLIVPMKSVGNHFIW